MQSRATFHLIHALCSPIFNIRIFVHRHFPHFGKLKSLFTVFPGVRGGAQRPLFTLGGRTKKMRPSHTKKAFFHDGVSVLIGSYAEPVGVRARYRRRAVYAAATVTTMTIIETIATAMYNSQFVSSGATYEMR
jgi:hypothetical protein